MLESSAHPEALTSDLHIFRPVFRSGKFAENLCAGETANILGVWDSTDILSARGEHDPRYIIIDDFNERPRVILLQKTHFYRLREKPRESECICRREGMCPDWSFPTILAGHWSCKHCNW